MKINILYIVFLFSVYPLLAQDLTLAQIQDLIQVTNDVSFTNVPSTSSNIYIEQIGDYNIINSRTSSSQESSVKYQQIGNYNTIDINIATFQFDEQIVQYGNNNLVMDYIFNPATSVQFHVEQLGNNLTLERFGSNSLSDKMEIKMEGANRTIILRNF